MTTVSTSSASSSTASIFVLLRFSSALEVHKAFPREMSSTIKFPNTKTDVARDMTRNDDNAERRGQELLDYYKAVFKRHDIIDSGVFRRAIEGTALEGLDLASLQTKYCRSYTKVMADPELVKRAMLYLRITGEVLCHDYEHVRFDTVSAAQSSDLRDRVFLRPQWLVDVMKELVHHDLEEIVETIDPSVVSDTVAVQWLGRDFANRGVLDKRLLPSTLLHYYAIVLLYYCGGLVLLYYCTSVLLCYCATVLLCYCATVLLCFRTCTFDS